MGSDKVNSKLNERRLFLKQMTVGAGALTSVGFFSKSAFSSTIDSPLKSPPIIDNLNITDAKSEKSWTQVKTYFPVKKGHISVNAANLCSASLPVISTLVDHTYDVAGDPSFENRAKYKQIIETTRDKLALLLGAESSEIAITRNTSESTRAVIGGIELKPDDNVVIWEQNHESNNVAWEVWSKRLGFKLIKVALPTSPHNEKELFEPFEKAINDKTKIISFSQVSNISGIALPTKRLCALARSKGILSLVDGAQTFGVIKQNLRALGCDFYVGSAHKWLCGPLETGVLYVRKGAENGMWPPMVTHDWDVIDKSSARKFDNLGQRDIARLTALGTAVDLHMRIGPDNIESRVRYLTDRIMTSLKPYSQKLTMLTPENEVMRAGIVIFMYTGHSARETMSLMYEKYGLSIAAADIGGQTWVRFAPHIYNSKQDIDVVIDAINDLFST